MKILIACEQSQIVTNAFREQNNEAFSNDIMPTRGNHPEWHLQGDIREFLYTSWDMVIAFPPCTHLAVSGARWFEEKRADGRQQDGINFFNIFRNLPYPKVVVENPIGIMSSLWRTPDQIIQPWEYGHEERKATCLWLKGVPKLQPTQIMRKRRPVSWLQAPDIDRSYDRSMTYQGIADAMAAQWS